MTEPTPPATQPDAVSPTTIPASAAATQPEASAASAPAEKSTVEKLQGWIAGLPEDAKKAGETVLEYAKTANAKIDFNGDGQPDLNQLANGATDAVKKAAGYLAEKGHAVYDALPEGAKGALDSVGEFMGNNKYGLGGMALAAILMMGLFEMGPLMSLLIGLLAGGLISHFMDDDKSAVHQITGGKEPSKEKGQAVELKKEADGVGVSATLEPIEVGGVKYIATLRGKETGEGKAEFEKIALTRQDKPNEVVAELTYETPYQSPIKDEKITLSETAVGNIREKVAEYDAAQKAATNKEGDSKKSDKGRGNNKGNDASEAGAAPAQPAAPAPAAPATPAASTAPAPVKPAVASPPAAAVPERGATHVKMPSREHSFTFMVNDHGLATTDESLAAVKVQAVRMRDLVVLQNVAERGDNGFGDFKPISENGISPSWATFNTENNKINLANGGGREAVTQLLGNIKTARSANEHDAASAETVQKTLEQEKMARQERERIEHLRESPEIKKTRGEPLPDGSRLIAWEYTRAEGDRSATYEVHGKERQQQAYAVTTLSAITINGKTHSISPIKVDHSSSTNSRVGEKLDQAIAKIESREEQEKIAAKQKSSEQLREVVNSIKGGVEHIGEFFSGVSKNSLGSDKARSS